MNEAGSAKYARARANYRACSGSGDLYGNMPNGGSGYTPGRGVFSVTQGQIFGGAIPPRQTTHGEITDGTSNTLLLAECMKQCVDAWGTISDITIGNMGAAFFTTFNTPNSTNADRPWGPCPVPQGDTQYKAPCSSLGGPNRPPGASNNNQRTAHATARSLHPGGVQAALADGSVRFFTNTIAIAPWRALGTMSLGEVVSVDN
jgi:prepilin-type processing-associated H-X9-DG protein